MSNDPSSGAEVLQPPIVAASSVEERMALVVASSVEERMTLVVASSDEERMKKSITTVITRDHFWCLRCSVHRLLPPQQKEKQ